MNADVRIQLRGIVEAVAFTGANTACVTTVAGITQDVTIANDRGPYLGLAEALYAGHYSHPDLRPNDPRLPDRKAVRFFADLRMANPIPERFERGVAVQREMDTGPGGHYVLLGRSVRAAASGRQVRFYWNFASDGARTFVREIGARFESARIPFQAKLPRHPQSYGRVDTGVLYLGDDDVEVALDAIVATHRAMTAALRPAVPLFTLPLACGLAFAESPPNGDSFGMHRCDLVAEGLVRAHRRGAIGTEARARIVAERLVEYGLDLQSFERNPLSRYPYRFDAFAVVASR